MDHRKCWRFPKCISQPLQRRKNGVRAMQMTSAAERLARCRKQKLSRKRDDHHSDDASEPEGHERPAGPPDPGRGAPICGDKETVWGQWRWVVEAMTASLVACDGGQNHSFCTMKTMLLHHLSCLMACCRILRGSPSLDWFLVPT